MILKDLKAVEDLLLFSVRKELEDQGHVMTGKLSKSIKVQSKLFAKQICIEGTLLNYGNILQTGVKASRIPYTQGSGKKKSKYIDGLVDFVKKKRIASGKKALGVAFAIAKKHKKEGMPTRASRRFSKTGRRTGFITEGLDKVSDTLDKLLNDIFEKHIDRILIDALKPFDDAR